jgi:hypothetical protein
MTKTLLSAVVLATLLLTGCAGSPASSPSSSPSAKPTITPSPSATPKPTKPALADLIVSPEGLGPLIVGQAPPVTDPAVDILVFDPDACYFVPEWDTQIAEMDDYGLWISNYGVDPHTNDPGPFGVYVEGGIVDTIGIYDESIETAAGAHLGMTRDELLAIYPTGIELETENNGIDTYRLRGTAGDLIFTLWDREAGAGYTVNQINVSNPGFTVPLGGSDYGYFGACFGP